MAKVHLLGINAMDPQGPERMRRALFSLNPDRIGIGATAKYLEHLRGEWIERNLGTLSDCVSRGLSRDRANYIENHIRNVFNYQFFIPLEYGEKTGTPVQLIGDDKEIELSRKRLDAMSLDPTEAEHHNFEHFRIESSASYEQHAKYVNGVIHLGNWVSDIEKEIIATQAKGIMATTSKHGDSMVYVCSLRDCLDAYIYQSQTIRSSIRPLQPEVSFLNQYEFRPQDVN